MEKLVFVIVVFGFTTSSPDLCKKVEWKCETGDCIRIDLVCDGIKDCRQDGSDEERDFCETWVKPNITQVKTDDGDCILDDMPNMKVYYASNPDSILRPRDIIDNYSQIKYVCEQNYKLASEGHDNTNTCINGAFISPRPKCSRTCSSDVLKVISVQALCFRDQRRFPCGETIYAGTGVKLNCAIGYEKPKWVTSPDEIKCLETGEWSSLPYYCQQICGFQKDYGIPLISGGEKVNASEVPWNTGIYKLKGDKYIHICGGTIVNAKMVLSAAHCFWDVINSKPHSKKDYSVTVGKNYRDYYANEPRSQKFKLKELFIPPGYQDASLNYQDDFAILVIDGIISFEQNVKPVCVKDNFENLSEKYLPAESLGTVAGWGITETGLAANQLRVTELQIKNKTFCKSQLPPALAQQIGNKYCVGGYDGGTSVCSGDSGSGLTQQAGITENGVQQYYLWGIVSTALTTSLRCSDTNFMSFTNVPLYVDEIREFAVKYRISTCHADQWQCYSGKCIPKESYCNRFTDCPDQSDESFCKYSTNPGGKPLSVSMSNRFQFQGPPPKGSCILTNLTEHVLVKYDQNELSEGGFIENHGRISYECSRHYKLVGSTKNACFESKLDDAHPECLLTCPSDNLEGETFKAKCSRNGKKVPCVGEVLAGTTATFSCKPRYVKPKNDRQIDVAICQPNGLWDFTDYKCVQECGVYTEVDNYVVNFGSGSVFYPWEVIVIRDFGEWNWMYYCSAVLLSARVVLSAPGCFIYNTDQYWVAILGDYDASYKIGEIYPADDEINYSVLILQRPIVFKAGIRPICLSQDKAVMATSDLTLNEMPQKVRIASDGCSDTKKLYNVADSKNQSSQIYTASMCKEMMSADDVADGTVEPGASFCVHWGSHKAQCLSKSEGAGVAIEIIEDKNRVHYLVGLLGSRKFVDENGDNYVWSVNMTSYIADLQSYVDKYSVK